MLNFKDIHEGFIGGRTVRDRFGRYVVVTQHGTMSLQAFLSFIAVYKGTINQNHRYYKMRIYDRQVKQWQEDDIKNYDEFKEKLKESASIYFLYLRTVEDEQKKLDKYSDQELAKYILENVYDNNYDKKATALAICDNVEREKFILPLTLEFILMSNHEDTDLGRITHDKIMELAQNNEGNVFFDDSVFAADPNNPPKAVLVRKTVPIEIQATKEEKERLLNNLTLENLRKFVTGTTEDLLLLAEEQNRGLDLPEPDAKIQTALALSNTDSIKTLSDYGLEIAGVAYNTKLENATADDMISKDSVKTVVKFIRTHEHKALDLLNRYKKALEDMIPYLPQVRGSDGLEKFKEEHPRSYEAINNMLISRQKFRMFDAASYSYSYKDVVQTLNQLDAAISGIRDMYPLSSANKGKLFSEEKRSENNDFIAGYMLNDMAFFNELSSAKFFDKLQTTASVEEVIGRALYDGELSKELLFNIGIDLADDETKNKLESVAEQRKKAEPKLESVSKDNISSQSNDTMKKAFFNPPIDTFSEKVEVNQDDDFDSKPFYDDAPEREYKRMQIESKDFNKSDEPDDPWESVQQYAL